MLNEENGIAYFKTSAKIKIGLNEGLSYTVNGVYDKLMEYDDKKMLDKKRSNKHSNCPGNKKGKNDKK